MGKSGSRYFERLFHWGKSRDTKLAIIEKFIYSSLEFLILSDADPRNSSISRVGTSWWVGTRMVNVLSQDQNPTSSNPKKKGKNILEEEFEVENWSRFIVLDSNEKHLAKISLFVIEKISQRLCRRGEECSKIEIW